MEAYNTVSKKSKRKTLNAQTGGKSTSLKRSNIERYTVKNLPPPVCPQLAPSALAYFFPRTMQLLSFTSHVSSSFVMHLQENINMHSHVFPSFTPKIAYSIGQCASRKKMTFPNLLI